jgi:hypothetical protein
MLIHFKSPYCSGNRVSGDFGPCFEVDEPHGILRALCGVLIARR